MKTYPKKLAILLLLFPLIMISCLEDDMDDPFADPVEKFLGTWRCEEVGDDFKKSMRVYNVTIRRNPNNTAEVLINPLNQMGEARALVTGNTLSVFSQTISTNFTVSGSGSYQNGEINFRYTTSDGANQEEFTARYYKP